ISSIVSTFPKRRLSCAFCAPTAMKGVSRTATGVGRPTNSTSPEQRTENTMRLNFWKRLFASKPRTTTRRPARPRLGIEALEDRLAPAINPSSLFSPLAAPVSNVGNSLAGILQAANTPLPIINQPLSSLANARPGSPDPGAIQSAIQNLVNSINAPSLD